MVSFIDENYVRCVWPGAPLPLGEDGDYVVNFFKKKYDINIEYLDQTKTSTKKGAKAGRIDQIFNVQNDSIEKFAQIKDKIGALYAKEIVQNNEHHDYKERIYLKYFQRTENDLLKAGDISKEDVYKRLS